MIMEEESFLCIDRELDQVKLFCLIKSENYALFLTNSDLNLIFAFMSLYLHFYFQNRFELFLFMTKRPEQ